jgi:hypothetical protein
MRLGVGDLVAFGALAVCAAAISFVQPKTAHELASARLDDGATALPPPKQLKAMSFGYHGAAADLVWAKLLVEYGVRTEQKRTFESLPRYLDAVLELEPGHRTLYQFVDALIFFKPGGQATPDDVRMSRRYLERGIKERPYDHEVWLHYGQFISFLAPSVLTDEAEIAQWRKDGALAIAHAVELGADADRSLAASTILRKSGGDTAANIQHLQRAYALTDNPDTRQQILFKLRQLEARSNVETVVRIVEQEWRSHYPFLSRSAALLVGPRRDPALCAGPHSHRDPACPEDWSAAIRDAL